MYQGQRKNPNNKMRPKSPKNQQPKKPSFLWFALLLFFSLLLFSRLNYTPGEEIKYGEFYSILKSDPSTIRSITKTAEHLEGDFTGPTFPGVVFDVDFEFGC